MTRTIGSKYLKFQIRLKEKAKSKTFEYLATEYGSLKSIALIFMIEINFRRRKERIACHMILEFRNPVTVKTSRKT